MYAWLALIILAVGVAAERLVRPKGGGQTVYSRLACYAGQGSGSSLVQTIDCALLSARLARYGGAKVDDDLLSSPDPFVVNARLSRYVARPGPGQAPPEDYLSVATRLTYYVGRQIQ